MRACLGRYWEVKDSLYRKMKLRGTQKILHEPRERNSFKIDNIRHFKKYDLLARKWDSLDRKLNSDIGSFISLTSKASMCPIPLIMDVWDGAMCPYKCEYCFMRAFYQKLYSFRFNDTGSMAHRHCGKDKFNRKMDKMMVCANSLPHKVSEGVERCFAKRVPVHFGIRFENFTKWEEDVGISLHALRYLRDASYPLTITTKSPLVARDDYLEAISSNKAGGLVKVSLITVDEALLKVIEPGAPTAKERLTAIRKMTKAGLSVVVRVNPIMPFITDDKPRTTALMDALWDAGVRDVNFEMFMPSDACATPEVGEIFFNAGVDFREYVRVFSGSENKKAVGDAWLELYAGEFKAYGFEVYNTNLSLGPCLCCGPQDVFSSDTGYNWGSTGGIYKMVREAGGRAVSWREYDDFVARTGGYLSAKLEWLMYLVWQRWDDISYLSAINGMEVCGMDEHGCLWRFNDKDTYYDELLKELTQ